MKALSDEIIEDCDLGFPVLDVDKVKQFIKDLKEEINKFAIHKTGVHKGFLCLKIDKLAGNKLTGEEKNK